MPEKPNYHRMKTLNPQYVSPFGTWKVTTEGDVEGKTTQDLGTYTGYIDEIALWLADRCYYSLQFQTVKPESVRIGAPTRKQVNISLGIDSGTWHMTPEERTQAISKIMMDNERPVSVKKSNYYASVTLTTDQRTLEERKKDAREAVLAKMTPEERELLGEDFGVEGC